jgi:hypothetical protein
MTELTKPDIAALQHIADRLHQLAGAEGLTLERAREIMATAATQLEADADIITALWDELTKP